MEVVYDPVILHLIGINPKELKIATEIVVYYTIRYNGQNVEKPRCPLTDEKINVVNSCNGILFSQKKERSSDTSYTTWMNLKNIILSAISQTQKEKYCMIPLT